MAELKPCPFCGGEAYLEENHRAFIGGKTSRVAFVRCKKCNARSGRFELVKYGHTQNSVEANQAAINAWNRRTYMVDVNLKVERLIAHYQEKADELKEAVDAASETDSTVSTYKWMHSLWRTVCSFVEDLDELAADCDIRKLVESCEDCGFCERKEN